MKHVRPATKIIYLSHYRASPLLETLVSVIYFLDKSGP